MQFKIGMRNIKTSIAVFISVLVTEILGLDSPFFAAIAAIFSMENSINNSFKAGRNRLLGTLVGAFVGVIFVSIQPNNAILCGIGIMAVIYICNIFGWNKAVAIAGVVFVSIMVNLNKKNPFQYSINRILTTLIGIIIAVAVNYIVSPPNNFRQISNKFDALSSKVSSTIKEMICSGQDVDLKGLRKEIMDLASHSDVYISEFTLGEEKNRKIHYIKNGLEEYRNIYEHLAVIEPLYKKCSLDQPNQKKIKKLAPCEPYIEDSPQDKRNIVFNYHVARILDIYLKQ